MSLLSQNHLCSEILGSFPEQPSVLGTICSGNVVVLRAVRCSRNPLYSRKFIIADSVSVGEATAKAFKSAALQVAYAKTRLSGIRAGLDSELLAKFEADSAARGGEQYLIDRSKISCEPSSSYAHLVCLLSAASTNRSNTKGNTKCTTEGRGCSLQGDQRH